MQLFYRQASVALALCASLLTFSCGEPEARPVTQAMRDAAFEAESAKQAAAEAGAVGSTEEGAASAAAQPPSRFAPGGDITDAQLADYYISMTCEVDGESVGTMTFDMWTEDAPITTRNFLRLADEGFYNGLTFHRILRDFMIQGGDPQGNGLGGSPYGKIKAEFSEEPKRRHGYGVLSMARGGSDINSASSQFFLCCDESQSVWGLDGKYTSFGKLTSGVATLETLASVPVTSNGREVSKPTRVAKITEAQVVKGAAPTGETVERPEQELDLGGEPKSVRIQQLLVGFKELAAQGLTATRTEDEAKALVAELKAKLDGGADMSALVREYSDLPFQASDEVPGDVRVLNTGVRDRVSERKMYDVQSGFMKRAEALRDGLSTAKLNRTEYQTAITALQEEANAAQAALGDFLKVPRTKLDPALNEIAFTMKVGEAIVLDHDMKKSSIGYRIVKRLE